MAVVAWIELPLRLLAVKARCRKPQNLVALRDAPVSLRSTSASESPAKATLRIPDRKAATGSDEALASLGIVSFDGEWWRPLTSPRGGLVAPDGMSRCRDEFVASGMDEWPLWPYRGEPSMLTRAAGIHREPELILRECATDPDAEALAEAEHLSANLILRDGLLFRRCGVPTVRVRAYGIERLRPTGIGLDPVAEARPERRPVDDVLQAFPAWMAADAEEYARAVAGPLSLHLNDRRSFDWHGAAPAPPPPDPTAFVARTHRFVGSMGRAVIEAWIDVREASPLDYPERLLALRRALSDEPRSALALHAWLEAERVAPEPREASREDLEAIAAA